MSGAGADIENRWTFGFRILSNQIPRAALRTTLTYRFHPRVQLGVEWNPRADEVSPLANILVVTETRKRPAVMIGTSTDRIGTPSGQSFYLTVSKDLHEAIGLPIAPYAGAAFGTFEDRLRPIGGFNLQLHRKVSALVTFNGVNVHPLITYSHKSHAFSLILVKGRDPGMSYSLTF